MKISNLKIKPQARKTLALKVTPKGVEVLIPNQLDPDSERVQAFIEEGLAKLDPPATGGESLSRDELMALVDRWAGRLGVEINRVQLRPMRQKWGSVSTNGNLTLADDLLQLPIRLVEYVICHELLHLKVPHHNRLYYLLLTQHIPDWQDREQELGGWVLFLRA